MRFRVQALSALALTATIALAFAGDASGGTTSSCTGPQQITVTWDFYESNSEFYPDWVGYDLMRRQVSSCTPPQRVNAEIIPRIVGQYHQHVYVDSLPAMAETYEYRPTPVDANRNEISVRYPNCAPDCSPPPTWSSCPPESAPISIGRITDEGWTLSVSPCPGTCYPGGDIVGPTENDLRAQGLVGSTVKLYGTAWCCGLEGASLWVTRWEPGTCGSTAGKPTSWGKLKTIYR